MGETRGLFPFVVGSNNILLTQFEIDKRCNQAILKSEKACSLSQKKTAFGKSAKILFVITTNISTKLRDFKTMFL